MKRVSVLLVPVAIFCALPLLAAPNAHLITNSNVASKGTIPFIGHSTKPRMIDPRITEACDNAQFSVIRGENLLRSGHVNESIAEFQDALNFVPTDGLAYERLAEAYMSLGKVDEASHFFHKVLVEGFGPGTGSGIDGHTSAWAEYALVLVKTNQTAEAVQAYNQAASLLDYRDSQFNGGKPTLKVPLPEIVMEPALPDQVQYTPQRLQALADTALAHENHDAKEEQAQMQEAVKLYPDSPVTHYYLGDVLLRANDPGARAAYQKAIELGDDQTVAAAKERLTQ